MTAKYRKSLLTRNQLRSLPVHCGTERIKGDFIRFPVSVSSAVVEGQAVVICQDYLVCHPKKR